jgi:hypothetical protein
LGRRLGGRLGADAAARDVHKATPVEGRGVHAQRLLEQHDVHRVVRVGGDPDLAREVVRRAKRHDAERRVPSVESVDDLVQRTIPADRDDDVDASVGRVGGEGRGIARAPRDGQLDKVPSLAHPAYHVTEVRTIRPCAVDDEDDMLLARHG